MAKIETIGISLLVRGAAAFSRDIGYVVNSLTRYASYVDRAQQSTIKLAQAQEKQAQRAVTQTANQIKSLTIAQQRYSDQIDRLNIKQQTLQLTIAGLTAKLALQKAGSVGAANTAMALANANSRQQLVDLSLAVSKRNLKATTDDLTTAQQNNQSATQRLAVAHNNLIKIAHQTNSVWGAVGQVFSVLSGKFGENLIQTTGLTGAIMKLGLRVSAVALVLDVFKLGLDAVTFVGKAVLGTLKLLWDIFSKLVGVVVNVGKAIVSWVVDGLKKLAAIPINIVVGALNGLWQSLKRIAEIAIGMNLSNLIWNFASKIKALGATALEAAGDFQALEIRMKALIQREQLETKGIAFGDSLAYASDKAEELTDWISMIAVKSRYTADAIANTFTLGMAYDLTADQSQRLTESIVNFATGMGLEEDTMRRIIENFGQMMAAGKLTGTELRDLARGAFLPVNRVLEIMGQNLGLDEQKMGDLRKKLQEMTTEGEISVKEFFEAFMQMSERDFPNSIEKMSRSWDVVKSNMKDFVQSVIGWRVIKPTLDIVSGRMADFISQFMKPEIIQFAKQLGRSIAFLADVFFKLSDAFTGKFKFNLMFIPLAFKKIYEGAKDFYDIITRGGRPVSEYAKSLASVKEGLLELLKPLGLTETGAGKMIEGFRKFMKETTMIGKKPLADSLRRLGIYLGEIIGPVWEEVVAPNLAKAWEAVWGWIKGTAVKIWTAFVLPEMENLWNNIFLPWFGTFWNTTLPDWLNNTAGPALVNAINGLASWVTQSDLGRSAGESITNGITTFMHDNAGPTSQFAAGIGSVLKSTFQIALASALQFITGSGQAQGAELPDFMSEGGLGTYNQKFTGGAALGLTPLQEAIANLATSAKNALDSSLKDFMQWAKDANEPWKTLHDTIMAFQVANPILAEIGTNIDRIMKALGLGSGEGGSFWSFIHGLEAMALLGLKALADGLGLIATALERINNLPLLKGILESLVGVFTFNPGKVLEGIGSISAALEKDVPGLFKPISTEAQTTSDETEAIFNALADTLINNSVIPDMLTAILTAFQTKLGEVLAWVKETFIQQMIAAFSYTNFNTIGQKAGQGLLDGFMVMGGLILAYILQLKGQVKAMIESMDASFKVTGTINVNGGGGSGGGTPKQQTTLGTGETVSNGRVASGGPVFPWNKYLVGEKGPEMFMPTIPGYVIPSSKIPQYMQTTPSSVTYNQGTGAVTNRSYNWNVSVSDQNVAKEVRYEYNMIKLLDSMGE